jgi:hypothetical protein
MVKSAVSMTLNDQVNPGRERESGKPHVPRLVYILL